MFIMKHILKQLETCNFIKNLHKQLLNVDANKYLNIISNIPKDSDFSEIKTFDIENINPYYELKIRYDIHRYGLYDQFLKFFKTYKNVEYVNSTEYAATIAYVGESELLVGIVDIEKAFDVRNYYFQEYSLIPVYDTIIDLDFNAKIYILLYNSYFKFPNISLN